MKKSIFLIFIFLILSNCGFAPIYSESNKSDFAIEIVETKGDGIVNNIIKSEIGSDPASIAFKTACELVFQGRNQPSGYTEPLLHLDRLIKKN